MLDLIAENNALKASLLTLVFAIVAILTYAAAVTATARQAARRRLVGETPGVAPQPIAGSLRSAHAESSWLKLVNAIEKSGINLVGTNEKALRQRMIAAGFPAPFAPRVFTLIRLALVIALPVALLAYYAFNGASPSPVKLYFSLMAASALGLYLPAVYVRRKADRRQRDIINGFPDALDLMLVCVEAGLGLEAAFARVGMEMTTSHPRLAEQLGAVVLELRAGRSHEDALRRMSDRAGADEIRAFATLLVQSTKLGSSIAQTLRIYASEMREKRRLRAEERAHRLPVLLSVPLVACMLPVMIGVLMLPAMIRVIRSVMPALTGG
jgi:tight adherence protein C